MYPMERIPGDISFLFTFIVNERIINSSYPLAHTNNTDYSDILVVRNTGRVFNTSSSATTVQCCERLPGSLECDKNFNTMKADVLLYYSKSFHWLFNNRLPSQHLTVL